MDLKTTIKKNIIKLYPELEAGLHLPQLAVVTSIPDIPKQNNISDTFRPYYAVNIRKVNAKFEIIKNIPEIKNVPCNISGGGFTRGTVNLPQPGTIVEFAYVAGKLSLPFIRSILPYTLTIPDIKNSKDIKIQNMLNSSINIDAAGNISIKTNANINENCSAHNLNAINLNRNVINENINVRGNSQKNISGIYKRIAGAIKLLTTGSAHLGATYNTNLTAGEDININAGRNIIKTVGGSQTDNISGQLKIIVEEDIKQESENAKISVKQDIDVDSINTTLVAKQNIDFKAEKIYVGSNTVNILQIISSLMEIIIQCYDIISTHTHPLIEKMSEGNKVKVQAQNVAVQKTMLDQITKK